MCAYTYVRIMRDPEILFLVSESFTLKRRVCLNVYSGIDRRQKIYWFYYEMEGYVDVCLNYLEMRFPFIVDFIMKRIFSTCSPAVRSCCRFLNCERFTRTS